MMCLSLCRMTFKVQLLMTKLRSLMVNNVQTLQLMEWNKSDHILSIFAVALLGYSLCG